MSEHDRSDLTDGDARHLILGQLSDLRDHLDTIADICQNEGSVWSSSDVTLGESLWTAANDGPYRLGDFSSLPDDEQAAWNAQAAVAALDAIDASDPESAHGEAEDILLALVPDSVREAYKRVVDRSEWWASA